jgi:hypothetical protein
MAPIFQEDKMMPFTPQDQAALDELMHRKALAEWSAREDVRVANLAALSEVAQVFTSATIAPIVECATSQRAAMASVDQSYGDMLGNIGTVMGYAGMQIVDLCERLAIPEPEPAGAATVAAPVED